MRLVKTRHFHLLRPACSHKMVRKTPFCEVPDMRILSWKFAQVLSLFGLAAELLHGQVPTASDIFKRISPSVVAIEWSDGKHSTYGSGFIVSADGKIITNYHVIAHTKNATVRLTNEDAYDDVQVLDADKRKDIVLLKIKAVDLPYVQLGRSNAVEIGQRVFTVSNPLGLGDLTKNTLSEGIVSGIRQADGYRLFQISAPISHGSSGGPVVNAQGEVIAVAEGQLPDGQNLNFSIPIDYARGMLQSTGQPQPLASIYEPPPPETASPTAPKPPEVVGTQSVAPVIPEEMRKSGLVYLERQMGKWKLNDAQEVFGPPLRQRDAVIVNGQADGIIYAFSDPTHGVREFELNFGNSTGLLRAVYAYPIHATLDEAKALWGSDYKVTKYPNGNRGYAYKKRRLIVITDRSNIVISIGVYLP